MKGFLLHAAAVACATLLALSAEAQVRRWAGPTSGAWDSPARWSPADPPDTPAETAVFDVFGDFAANLSQPLVAIGNLSVDRGVVAFRTTGGGNSLLEVGGDFSVAGAVSFPPVASTWVLARVAGDLDVAPGGSLVLEGGRLDAEQTTLAGGALTEVTLLELRDGALASLGDLRVGLAGAAGSRGQVAVGGGSGLRVGALQVATDSPHAVGEIDVVASSLTQDPESVAIIGRAPEAGAVGRGSLAVSEGGQLSLDTLVVRQTGKLINFAGAVTIREALRVEGGLYEERAAASRDFAGLASIDISESGTVRLTNLPLTVGAGQTLTLADGRLESPAGLALAAGGRLAAEGVSASVVDAVTTLTPTGVVAIDAGATLRFERPFQHEGGAFTAEVGSSAVFAAGYSGDGVEGAGSVIFHGDVRPGRGVGHSDFGGAVTFAEGSALRVELAGREAYDRLSIDGAATLGGALRVEVLDGGGVFAPAEGERYRILEAQSLAGGFETYDLPSLTGTLEWRVLRTGRSLDLLVVEPSVAGDFNHDGAIDAADFTVWRDAAGTIGPLGAADADSNGAIDAADLAVWRGAYGGGPAPVAIPEGGAVAGVCLFLVATLARAGGRL